MTITAVATADPPKPPRLEQALVGHILHWNPYKEQWMVVRSIISWHKSWEK